MQRKVFKHSLGNALDVQIPILPQELTTRLTEGLCGFKHQTIIGINHVTKYLESHCPAISGEHGEKAKDADVSLVFVCVDTQPKHIWWHLLFLCHLTGIKFIPLVGARDALSRAHNQSVVCIAIHDLDLEQLCQDVQINIPWLPHSLLQATNNLKTSTWQPTKIKTIETTAPLNKKQLQKHVRDKLKD
jgi:ribosomal protein L7Ae-like RNA K-turn-binding protein